MRFRRSTEYQVFPTQDRPLRACVAAVGAAAEMRHAEVRQTRPDAVVAHVPHARSRAGG